MRKKHSVLTSILKFPVILFKILCYLFIVIPSASVLYTGLIATHGKNKADEIVSRLL